MRPRSSAQQTQQRFTSFTSINVQILTRIRRMRPRSSAQQTQQRSRAACVHQLQRDHNIVQHIVDDVRLLAASLAVFETPSCPDAAASSSIATLTRSNSQVYAALSY
jgi:hypothetical protein